ncbi:MAG TPA: H(+)/Cl(-) exchange transporter ClcA, partial [Bryobacteraceae bacterium]|nr:H(+)/Cl(-) exchange transporter ClcA [Bryobacteraceae bacterium]
MADSSERQGALLLLALLSCVVGTAIGLIVAVFRIALQSADRWRDAWIARAHGWPIAGLLVTVAAVTALTAAATWLVQRLAPEAAGSGIPRVEAVGKGELTPAPFRVLPVKFIGGWFAIGGGLALGREGPSVQMGALLGSHLATIFRLTEADSIALLAAGGGAGLAVAFNAPIAGAVFVLEELIRRFDTRICIAALGASCCAIAIARMFLGSAPDFNVTTLPDSGLGSGVLFFALGALAGLAGVTYNAAVLGVLKIGVCIHRRPELRAALIGAIVGMLAWFAPALVGGGEPITQRTLAGAEPIALLPLFFGIRFALGPLSYAAGTPGGLFAPMLVLGAQLGVLFATVCHFVLPHARVSPAAFAVVGMAAFFTAVVRSPVTGIVLVVELTAGFTQLIPMLWASFAAMLIPTILGNMPIYDSLSQPGFLRHRGQQSPHGS